ncbi:MAG: amidophosphoribosyltransferase [Bdellovibrionales bacterium]|nr:amidophosphoribosyltransferase [Bdellovibrionales bacterium]
MKDWNEECAVFGIWGDPEAGKMAYLGLYAQQHRGQESAGISTLSYGGRQIHHKGVGLVGEVFPADVLERLNGRAAIGHVRYSTTGTNSLHNVQPLTAGLLTGPVAMAHNGNIVNSKTLRKELKKLGAIFQGTNDTECLLHLLARHPSNNLVTCLKESVQRLDGAYSLVLLAKDKLVAMRDPRGMRPLILGQRHLEEGGFSWVVASETCAFDLIGAKYIREIEPGEIWWVDENGEHSERFAEPSQPLAQCVFEHVYFARPDSKVFGKSVYETRKRMGEILAEENPVEADFVIPVPDSGTPAAIGYSQKSGIPFELGIIRNHYIGRTFIQPSQSIRSFGVKIKLNPQAEILKGKRVVVVDDSLVRGTTSQKIIRLVRQAGAKEVHFRIASPPTTGPCYYGVDTPEKSELIANQKSLEGIRSFIDADTLAYLTINGMMQAVGSSKAGYCAACFDGQYPTDI